jgi:hypothetical protein
MNTRPYGTMAEFASEGAFLAALTRVKQEGHRNVDTFTPYGVEAEEGVAPRRRSPVAAIMLAAGIIGGLSAYLMQWYATRAYRLNVGGRPILSWPAFIPVTFELTVLSAALAGAASLLWLAGLPRLDHPAFSNPRFRRASQDRFFICIRADDPGYTSAGAKDALLRVSPLSVEEIFE